MTGYDSHLTITVPASLADVAAMVGRAMDPDTGGAESFSRDVIGYSETGDPLYGDTITCRTVCGAAFRAQAMAMLGNPAALKALCDADYAKRWPGITPPTLEQCAAFVASVKVE